MGDGYLALFPFPARLAPFSLVPQMLGESCGFPEMALLVQRPVEQSGVDGSVDGGIADLQRVILKLQPVRYLFGRPVLFLYERAYRLAVLKDGQLVLPTAVLSPLLIAYLGG